ncbi:hypothetical protein C4D60_Mb11t18430 [Musa balbisiana]|uniref:Uncharacterized protein n=1 Tax=Musa balbisiana TaxID=52838 RepID=A0A4S8J7I7_MUSBA|nr:hypothetical protein C4D60_Mb11t18430 [Musa balbisiana]
MVNTDEINMADKACSGQELYNRPSLLSSLYPNPFRSISAFSISEVGTPIWPRLLDDCGIGII